MNIDDAAEVGRRIAAARGYAGGTIESFAARLGISAPTLRSYERGELGNYAGSSAKRRALLDHVREVAGVPPEVVGLSEPGEAVAAEILRRLESLELALPALRSELLATMAQELAARDARRSLPKPGDSAEGLTGG